VFHRTTASLGSPKFAPDRSAVSPSDFPRLRPGRVELKPIRHSFRIAFGTPPAWGTPTPTRATLFTALLPSPVANANNRHSLRHPVRTGPWVILRPSKCPRLCRDRARVPCSPWGP
jgi:hypothetical protein